MDDEYDYVLAHMQKIEKRDVDRLASTVRGAFGSMPFTLRLELDAFLHDRTIWDALRVSRALRHHYDHPQIADEIDAVIAVTQAEAQAAKSP